MSVAYVRPRSALGAASADPVADSRLRGSWEPPAILGLSSTRAEQPQEPTVPRNFRDGKGDQTVSQRCAEQEGCNRVPSLQLYADEVDVSLPPRLVGRLSTYHAWKPFGKSEIDCGSGGSDADAWQ